MWTAPDITRASSGSSGGPCPATSAITRPTRDRKVGSVSQRSAGQSRPAAAPFAQRFSCTQPRAAAPAAGHGLTCSRTRFAACFPAVHSASASAMLAAAYSRRRQRPRGPTVTTAPQPRHRNRRSQIDVAAGDSPTASTPRTCRSRSPCPMRPGGPPTGCPASPHAGHCVGRATSTVGGLANQSLTSPPISQNLSLLRSARTRSGARRVRCANTWPATYN